MAPYREGGTQSHVGSLMYEGGCLLFDGEDGPTPLLPIWPAGSRFEESLITFHRPAKADQRVIIGEEVRLDGQAADWSDLPDSRLVPFQHQCGGQPFFVSAVTPAN
jgi:hypothetical protein